MEYETSPTRDATEVMSVRDPCVETPARFVLHCNGYYLCGSRNGTLLAKKSRSEKCEWQIETLPPREKDGCVSKVQGEVVAIRSHTLGSRISVATVKNAAAPSGFTRIALCVKDPPEQQGRGKSEKNICGKGGKEQTEIIAGSDEQASEKVLLDNKEEANESVHATSINLEGLAMTSEGQHWQLVCCDAGIQIKSGSKEGLCITAKGSVVLLEFPGVANATTAGTHQWVWKMECVTGELCFLSSPVLDLRVRCDMAGLVTLSPNWKGWEVMRLLEWRDGYVSISSWMHSGWLLCCHADGSVTACSHAESLCLDDNHPEASRRCSKWAIEKYCGGGAYDGVIVRSMTHGSLLCIRDGVLGTYNGRIEGREGLLAQRVGSGSGEWWKNSLTSEVQKKLSSSAIQHRNFSITRPGDFLRASFTREGREEQRANRASIAAVSESKAIVWQLEAAHTQTYYFLSQALRDSDKDRNGNEKSETVPPVITRSIGVFPQVTENLRTSAKIQLIRASGHGSTSAKLYLTEQKSYFACTSNGKILLTTSKWDEGTDWIIDTVAESPRSGNIFRSRVHGLILSHKVIDTDDAGNLPSLASDKGTDGNNATLSSSSSSNKPKPKSIKIPGQLFDNILNKHKPTRELCGADSLNLNTCLWTLEPCMPRAVSSEKLRIFAIGTSVAIGTTVAMPFALAGVAAVMGAVGAEAGIGFGIVAAGLTGAEALASVGAIGATAYLCFRPAANSLSSEASGAMKVEECPRSKRPFSNWRNW